MKNLSKHHHSNISAIFAHHRVFGLVKKWEHHSLFFAKYKREHFGIARGRGFNSQQEEINNDSYRPVQNIMHSNLVYYCRWCFLLAVARLMNCIRCFLVYFLRLR